MRLRQVLVRHLETKLPSLPDRRRVYVIGDIHGCDDLLGELRNMIADDCRFLPPTSVTTVFLGDYVDRGPNARGVLRILADDTFPTSTVFLKGNHEAMMLEFLYNPDRGCVWLANGGLQTLLSYNVDVSEVQAKLELANVSSRMLEALPASHKQFLLGLRLAYEAGDYFFCHAGVRPGVRLDRQVEDDLLWIRGTFLRSSDWFGKIVVHGHTAVREPEVLPNRINIDTEAYISGRLTCLILEGTTHRFLVAGSTDSQHIAW